MTLLVKSLSVKRRIVTVLSALLVFGGTIFLLAPPIMFQLQKSRGLAANTQYWRTHRVHQVAKIPALGTPVKFTMPRLGIDLDVTTGYYAQSTQTWRLDRVNAFYIAPGKSPLAADSVPLIYGHDIPAVFNKLNGIAKDEPLIITNAEGKKLAFVYRGEDILQPNQGSLLNSVKNDGKHVNVLTCTGHFFTERRLMHFEYVGPTKGSQA